MFTSGQFRAKAVEYSDLAKIAGTPAAALALHKLEQSYSTLADNEQWLSDHYDQTVHAPLNADSGKLASTVDKLSLAVEEEHILRYLGAALIMKWNTLPKKLQRELFDMAGSMGELLETASLRGQIARFLHKHKDDEMSA